MTDTPEAPTTVHDDQNQTVWTCKIGVIGFAPKPPGADGPMRRAAELKFRAVTGRDAEFCFSGWGGKLDECELAVVENRLPEPDATRPDVALVRHLVESLNFYAANHEWPNEGPWGVDSTDFGDVAREAIEAARAAGYGGDHG